MRARSAVRGQGQPVWILVAVLLAVIVAVTMYRIATRINVDDLPNVDQEAALTRFMQMCGQWRDMSWSAFSRPAADEGGKKTVELYGYRSNPKIITREEIESGKQVGACDCIVFLHKRGLMDRAGVLQLWMEHKDCNSWAKNTGCAENYCGTSSAAAQCKKDHGCTGG